MAQDREATMERKRVSETTQEGNLEAEGHHPMDVDASAEAPDSPPLSIQLSSTRLPCD